MRFPEYEWRQAAFLAAKAARLMAAEAQGVCSDCTTPLERPLNPHRPDLCCTCDYRLQELARRRPPARKEDERDGD